jgi:phosphonoacetate hydrolase
MTISLLICIDGCSPEYLKHADTPILDELTSNGFYKEVQAMVPTVTNLNMVSIVTGAYPKEHGIISNYYLDRDIDKFTYMETADYILCDTVFDRLKRVGRKSALLTVKDKLRNLLYTYPSISISAERPPGWLVDHLGSPPDVYSLEVNHWLMKALIELLRSDDKPDFVFLATTDYPMHNFAPENASSAWHLSILDKLLGEVLNNVQGIPIVAVTADHGMGKKTRAIDLNRSLGEANIPAEVVSIIQDRYVEHHKNMGGAAYIYLKNPSQLRESCELLEALRGVERVLPAPEAAISFHLHPERIGDILVLAGPGTVFGDLNVGEDLINIRSHGSVHERKVPLIGYGGFLQSDWILENRDSVMWIEQELKGLKR